MSSIESMSEKRAIVRNDLSAIFVSLELSRSTWLVTSLLPGGGEKMSKYQVRSGERAFWRDSPNCRRSAKPVQGSRPV